MPGGDRTGPMGMGPMTGRGAGYCNGRNVSGYAGTWRGRDFRQALRRGTGFWNHFGGGGRGWRNWFAFTGRPGWMRNSADDPDYQKPEEISEDRTLKEEVERLRSELCAIDKRLAEIGAGAEKA